MTENSEYVVKEELDSTAQNKRSYVSVEHLESSDNSENNEQVTDSKQETLPQVVSTQEKETQVNNCYYDFSNINTRYVAYGVGLTVTGALLAFAIRRYRN